MVCVIPSVKCKCDFEKSFIHCFIQYIVSCCIIKIIQLALSLSTRRNHLVPLPAGQNFWLFDLQTQSWLPLNDIRHGKSIYEELSADSLLKNFAWENSKPEREFQCASLGVSYKRAIHLNSPESTWIQLNSPESTRTHLNPPGFFFCFFFCRMDY